MTSTRSPTACDPEEDDDRDRMAVVVMTHNRRKSLLRTLDQLTRLPEMPSIIVADNGSSDGTTAAVRQRHPDVDVLALDRNLGVEARNLAAARSGARYVAFSDDDSWWAPGSLARAAALLDANPRLGLLCARIVVGDEAMEDPVCDEMRDSPVRLDPDLPGVPILGFLACAAVVRREAYEGVGGFDARFHFGGEEELLATDLAVAGWGVRYVPELVAHHHPSLARDPRWRRRRGIRNTLWSLWLRRPAGHALRRSGSLMRDARHDAVTIGATLDALRGLRWVLRERRVVPAHLERELRRLELARDGASTRQYR